MSERDGCQRIFYTGYEKRSLPSGLQRVDGRSGVSDSIDIFRQGGLVMDNNFNEFEKKTQINGKISAQDAEGTENRTDSGMPEKAKENIMAIKEYKKLKCRAVLGGMAAGVFGTIAVLLLTITILVAVGYIGFQRNTGQSSNSNAENQSVISEALEEKIKYMLYIMENNGLSEIDYEALVDGMLHGLVSGLDDNYAAYYNADELAEVQQSNAGTYYGIGVTVQQDVESGVVTVVEVTEDGPADNAGVQAEDIIYMVGDEEVTNMDINEIVARIKGAEGTTVNVTFYRPSAYEYKTYELERRNLKQIISYGEMLEDNIGYIRIKSFDAVTYEQLAETVETLKGQGMEAVVLDLRSNTGGLLTSLVDVAEVFLPKGSTILTIEDKNGVVEEYDTKGASDLGIPMAVLVNQYTASAAEALTGSIQDYGIGTIIGTTTFGKGIVQNTYPISDGTAIKLTIARYMTPNGRCIQDEGIEPDVVVELDESDEDNQLAKALEILKEKMGE